MPLSPPEQFVWPPYVNNLEQQLLPDFMDASPTPSWTDPSTSNSSPSAISSRTSLSSPSTELSPCRVCGQSFAKRGLLNRHTNQHTKPYKCSFRDCHKSLATRRDLQRHMDVHNGMSAPRYVCPERGCEYAVKGFKRKDNLKRHLKNVHLRLVA
ncbi:hypothetical protein BKA61DRAFT_678725 [Leptodontidium sp. MPI-SDFR-AT-0119]|nr:hypothetical protein BKA61DRAFT_678725 [Leptodontidium sp. MPI-SDFR-AT-0119]